MGGAIGVPFLPQQLPQPSGLEVKAEGGRRDGERKGRGKAKGGGGDSAHPSPVKEPKVRNDGRPARNIKPRKQVRLHGPRWLFGGCESLQVRKRVSPPDRLSLSCCVLYLQ